MSLDVIETRMVGNPEIDVWNSKCFIISGVIPLASAMGI